MDVESQWTSETVISLESVSHCKSKNVCIMSSYSDLCLSYESENKYNFDANCVNWALMVLMYPNCHCEPCAYTAATATADWRSPNSIKHDLIFDDSVISERYICCVCTLNK